MSVLYLTQKTKKERNERHNYNREATQVPVVRISKDLKDFVYYKSATEASRALGYPCASSISSVCSGSFITYKGFYWHYDDGSSKESIVENIKARVSLSNSLISARRRKDYFFISDKGEIYEEFINMTIKEISSLTGISYQTLTNYRRAKKYKGKYRLKTLEEASNE